MEKVLFIDPDTNEKDTFFVLADLRLNEISYLLVTGEEEDDGEAFILREMPGDEEDEEASYEMVEDEEELSLIGSLFMEDLDGITIEHD